ncbi:hypothetical protein UK23_47980 [Lentzea aerocolonigenes]|uniref:Streptomyces killer toxin-like beta/gamma crystallin domain-containing protein n=1 Tax=Lentzea aerocolonigenes TaxID=68170 RepID=A0A0F0GEF8_LENAE|nr:hypothetical protein [Lentzea aerocolonigenes]KJK32963.1 hypothetical protein UK23_47980 [Lentzea aerocolonigenes]
MIAALGAALLLTVGFVTPASATHQVGYQECVSKHVFFEFFRNNSTTDKYCYAGENPQTGNVVQVGLDNITWVHAGNNTARVKFYDRFGTYFDRIFFPGFDDGCDYCRIVSIQIA